ncbi:hypothetical protein ACIQBJ_11225 [Kitasatospora sp. NPDC088391]|uniref:hypothetical protein n=1 Tax=Kitasatospora sp. NPDC088391 TaxID=3364074 RepID=UPI0037FC47A2
MSVRARLRRSAAVALVSAVTAGSALLLTACDPEGGSDGNAATTAENPPATQAGTPTGARSSTGPAPMPTRSGPVNRTAGTGLTVSTNSAIVLMDGKTVDFGTVVRDLAWSPDGKRAAFIDGNGNLQTSDPDGGHKTLVAKAPTGVTWSHPAWQVTAKDEYDRGRNNLVLTAQDHGTLRLLTVPASGGTPAVLGLNGYVGGETENPVPQTGNLWPNPSGDHGTLVYANQADGQVYVRDDYLRQQGGALTKGSQPAGDDNGDLVFVRSVAGHSHIFTRPNDESRQERDLTPNATADCTEPAFSPDGKTVAFRDPNGIWTVPVGGGKPQQITDAAGLPAFRS